MLPPGNYAQCYGLRIRDNEDEADEEVDIKQTQKGVLPQRWELGSSSRLVR